MSPIDLLLKRKTDLIPLIRSRTLACENRGRYRCFGHDIWLAEVERLPGMILADLIRGFKSRDQLVNVLVADVARKKAVNIDSNNLSPWFYALLVVVLYGYIIIDIAFGNTGDPWIIAYMLSGVIAVGVIGALIVRFQPKKMFYVLMAMAAIQGVEAVVMLTMPSSSLGPTLLVNVFLIAGLVVTGVAFRKSAKAKSELAP